ncbi:MAG TPA: hypothetical protein VMN36_15750 [Verrucomicrobiales bacterium]|nr:hypothetical protein [Verrucomicrobiales bacterium]
MAKKPAKTPAPAPTAVPQELLAALRSTLPGLVGAAARKINVDQVKADSGTVSDIAAGRVTLGVAQIDRLTITGLNASLNGAQAFMRNVRMVLELRFTLTWKVDLGWLGSWGDTENLGSLHFGMNLGNVSVPSLANINFQVPSLSTTNVSAAMQPITNLSLGAADFNQLLLSATQAPSPGFTLSGLGVGSASVKNVEVPQTTTAQVKIDAFQPANHIVLPGAEVQNLQLPSAQAGTITAGGFNLSAIASRRCLVVDLGILDIELCVEPVTHLNVGSMLVQDVALSAAASRLNIENIALPINVQNIALNNMNLYNIRINEITL